MMDQLIEKFSSYGLTGLVLLASYVYIWFKDKNHLDERRDWLKYEREQKQSLSDVILQNAKAMQELHSVVTSLNMIITNVLQKVIDQHSE